MGYAFEEIRERMRDDLENPVSRIEGTFSMDNLQAVAQELARIHNMELTPMLDAAFLDTATGENLDKKVLDYGESRRGAIHATGQLLFTGTVGTYIPAGTAATSDGLTFETLEAARIGTDGTALVSCQCTQPGSVGNVPAGTITGITGTAGVSAVTNPAAFEGGADEETDDALRERVLEKIQTPITSGNENHYVYWAKQVSGVGSAYCFGTWNGPGTVKVTILADNGQAPDDTLVASVRAYIEENMPIGADLTVAKAQSLTIHISAGIVLSAGYALEEITEGVEEAVREYFVGIAFDGVTRYLSYHKIGELIFSVDGVADILDLTVNGQTSTIEIGAEEFCVLGTVNLYGT